MKNVLLILSIMLPLQLQAVLPLQPTFTWTAPTEFEDGSSLSAVTDLSGYTLRCNSNSIIITIDASVTSYTAELGMFPSGDYSCVMTSTSISGQESVDSIPKSFGVNFAPMQIEFTVQ